MLDKKLTDSKIIKALECCGKLHIEHIDSFCNECIFKDKAMCIGYLCDNSIDLINRLQDENRKIKAEKEILLHTTVSAYTADETIKELQAKVERRDKLLKEVLKGKVNIKAEAYKECIEKVKMEAENATCVYEPDRPQADNMVYHISNIRLNDLLKELVGEDNG